jgi:hypothetical protein
MSTPPRIIDSTSSSHKSGQQVKYMYTYGVDIIRYTKYQGILNSFLFFFFFRAEKGVHVPKVRNRGRVVVQNYPCGSGEGFWYDWFARSQARQL